jgi:hypothetical protein
MSDHLIAKLDQLIHEIVAAPAWRAPGLKIKIHQLRHEQLFAFCLARARNLAQDMVPVAELRPRQELRDGRVNGSGFDSEPQIVLDHDDRAILERDLEEILQRKQALERGRALTQTHIRAGNGRWVAFDHSDRVKRDCFERLPCVHTYEVFPTDQG